ncbi:MAG: c-type cytochrome [Pseudomonadota bacterium]
MKRSAQMFVFGVLIAGMAIAAALPAGAAPVIALSRGDSDNLRAVVATSQDIAEGQKVAEAWCVRCHGIDGIGAAKGVPHIAGQRPAYVYQQLKNYQSGGRGDKPMNDVVKPMNYDALMKVSAYYASLEPAQPAAVAGVIAAPAKADPVSAGKAAAVRCSVCHGETGISKMPGMPNLSGLDQKYLVAAVNAYKSGQRKNDLMKAQVAALGDAELNDIALFLALQAPGKAQTPAPGKPEAGKAADVACAICHGEGGVGGIPAVGGNPSAPGIAGQEAQYFVAAMRAYKDGSRADPAMKASVAALDEATVTNMAAYYAGQQPQAPKVHRVLSAAEWAERCDRCHGVNGNSTDPNSPALAAQRADYLEQVLHAYRKGTRKNSQMAAMSGVLSDEDIIGIATYYAGRKPRSVIYVSLPCK